MASDKEQRTLKAHGCFKLVMRYMQVTRERLDARLAELVSEARVLDRMGAEITAMALNRRVSEQEAAYRKFVEHAAGAIERCREVIARMDEDRREVVVKVPVRTPPRPSIN
jgi:hypothetical protein